MQKFKCFVLKISIAFFCNLNIPLFSIQQEVLNIHRVDTFDLLEQEVKMLGKDDLVIFDVDEVLLIEADAIFGVKAENKACWKRLFCEKQRDPKILSEEGRFLYSIVRQQSICIPVDEKIVQIILDIQANGTKTIALTAVKSGRNGIIEKTEDWRFNQLKAIGIDFSGSFHLEELAHPLVLKLTTEYQEHPSTAMQHPVLVQKGIIFAGAYDKGDVLRSFLTTIKWKPKRIIFIDDKRNWIESIGIVCKEFGIEFMRLHYTGAEKVSKSIDENVASFQVDYFFKHKVWLSDEQAQAFAQQLKKDEKEIISY